MANPNPIQGSPDVTRLSASMIVIAVFVEVLRERFGGLSDSDPSLSNYLWTSDPKATKIFIDSGFNENAEVRGKRPGLYVDRTNNVYSQVSIGNYDQIATRVHNRLENFMMFADMDMIVECISPNRGESMLIGSVAQDFLQMTAKPIMGHFGLRNISPMILGRTEPLDKERTLWNTPLQFRVNYEVRWATIPAAVLLTGITARIADIEAPTLYFRDVIPTDTRP
jgi:hypothetical protein